MNTNNMCQVDLYSGGLSVPTRKRQAQPSRKWRVTIMTPPQEKCKTLSLQVGAQVGVQLSEMWQEAAVTSGEMTVESFFSLGMDFFWHSENQTSCLVREVWVHACSDFGQTSPAQLSQQHEWDSWVPWSLEAEKTMMFTKTCVKAPPQLQPQRLYLSGGMFSFFFRFLFAPLALGCGSRSGDSCNGGFCWWWWQHTSAWALKHNFLPSCKKLVLN